MTRDNDASRVDPVPAVDKAERSGADFSVQPSCSDQGSGPASDAPAPPREEPELIRANMSIETPDAAPREEPLFTDEQVAALKAAAFAAHSADGGSEDVFRAFCGCGFRSFGSPGLPLCSLLRAVRFARSAFAASPAQEATPPREPLDAAEAERVAAMPREQLEREWTWRRKRIEELEDVVDGYARTRAAPTPEARAPEPKKGTVVIVPAYPGGAYRYRHDGHGWLIYAEGHDDNHYRGALVSESDELWVRARFAECLTAFAATVAALTAERDALRLAGSRLSNIAYNLAQQEAIDPEWRRTMDECRRDWDAARAAPRGAAAP